MEITIEKEFGEVFRAFIKEQSAFPYSCRPPVAEIADYIRELIYLLPSDKEEADAILTALKDRNDSDVTQMVKDGLR